MPTRQSFYLELVGPGDLTNAMSLNTATFTGTRMLGPLIAAVILNAWGMAPVFLINGISYVAVIAAFAVMRPAELRPRERVPRRPGQVREGVRYVWNTAALRLPMLVMGTIFLFSFNFTVLLPLLALRTFRGDEGTYGTLLALFGAGSLVGALVLASRTARANVRLLSAMGIVLGAVTTTVALAPWLPLALALMPLLGASAIGFAIIANSTLQLTASGSMRGRVMALYSVVFLGSTPIGGPIAGWVGEHLGPRTGLVGGGVVALVAGLAGMAALGRSAGRGGALENRPPGTESLGMESGQP
jgi:predicted MFS family arabinose efflux permease